MPESIVRSDRSSVAPLSLSNLTSAPNPTPTRPARWLLTTFLPILSSVFAVAVAYAAPSPRYLGPPAERSIALPDVVVMSQTATQPPDPNSADTPPEQADSGPPAIWVYDLPVAGDRPARRPPTSEAPLTISAEQLPIVP
jgi:hypothetical protein